MATLTIAEIARQVGGEIQGAGTGILRGVAGLSEAQEGDLSFLANTRYSAQMAATKASAVIVPHDWKGDCPAVLIRVRDADKAFALAAPFFAKPAPRFPAGIHPTAVVAEDARLGAEVSVGPHCVIEPGVVIGDRTILVAHCYIGHGSAVGSDCRFYPQVSLREYTKVGDRVILHNGCVLGSDGFGYVNEGGAWKKIAQIGVVEVGNDVEIGANTTVDRARFGVTRIGAGVKIDNLVQIAHNVSIGENSAFAAQVGISGSTHVGKRVRLGGQVGLAGHIEIGDDAVVGAQSGVMRDVPPRVFYLGAPAMPHDQFMKMQVYLMRLGEWKAKLSDLSKRLEKLEQKPS